MSRPVLFIITAVASLLGCAAAQPLPEPIENPTLGSIATGADPLPQGDRWTHASKLAPTTVFKLGAEYCVNGHETNGDMEIGRDTAIFQAELALSAALVGKDMDKIKRLHRDVSWWPHIDRSRHDVLLCVTPPAGQRTAWSVPTFTVDPPKAIAATIEKHPAAESPKPPIIVKATAADPALAAPAVAAKPAAVAPLAKTKSHMTLREAQAGIEKAWKRADALKPGDSFRQGGELCSVGSAEISKPEQGELGEKLAVSLAGGNIFRAFLKEGIVYSDIGDVLALTSQTYSRFRNGNRTVDTLLCVNPENKLAAN